MLDDLHNYAGAAPLSITSLAPLGTLLELEAAVEQDASMWCGGIKAGAPEKTPLQLQTLTAGELISFMQGKRGVVIVQLWNGSDPYKGQPLYDPWVSDLMEQALATPGVRSIASVAPGGLGLCAVLYADREPWASWAPHLATFGCQANAVAGSAYYKVLVGKILGYSDENILNYVAAFGGLSAQTVTNVDNDLKRLSKTKPKLPWNRESSRGKKTATAGGAPAASPSVGPGMGAAGRKGGSGRK